MRDWSKIAPKHGHAKAGKMSRVYRIWTGMRNRCSNKRNRGYEKYGGRGIKVCERWSNFANFLEDMGEPPSDAHEIERKNNNGNYEPSNCRWATRKEQANNRRSSRVIEMNGKSQTLAAWCAELGIRSSTVSNRIAAGLTPQEALTAPVRQWAGGHWRQKCKS